MQKHMKSRFLGGAFFVLACLSIAGQTPQHRATIHSQGSTPAGKKEVFQFVRAKMMLIPRLGESGVSNVEFDPDSCILTAHYRDGFTIENPLGSLDANAVRWNVGEENAGKFLTLDILNKPDGAQIAITDGDGKRQTRPFSRFTFSLQGAAETPNFQVDFEKAITRLIGLCGGTPLAANR